MVMVAASGAGAMASFATVAAGVTVEYPRLDCRVEGLNGHAL